MLIADPLQDLLKFLKSKCNKLENFQFVMMIFICLGIHPEILFEFMPYVPINDVYLSKLKMMSLGVFFYGKLLSSPGFNSPSRQRYLFSRLGFKKVILVKMLATFGGCQLLPLIFPRTDSKDIPMIQCASALSFLRCSRMKVNHIFSRSLNELLLLENALLLQKMILTLHHQFPDVILFFREHPVQLKNFLEFWKGKVVFFLFHDSNCEKAKHRQTNMDFFVILIIVSLFDPTFLQQKLEQFLFCGNLDLENLVFTPQQNRLFLELLSLFEELSMDFYVQRIFSGKLNLKYLLQELQTFKLCLYQIADIQIQRKYAEKKDYKKVNHNGPPGYSGKIMFDLRKFSFLLKSFGPITENLFQELMCSHTETIFAKFPSIIGLIFSQFQVQMRLNLRRYPDVYFSVEFQEKFRRLYFDVDFFSSVSHWVESSNLSDIDFLKSTMKSDSDVTEILSVLKRLERNEPVSSISFRKKKCCECYICNITCYSLPGNTCFGHLSCFFCRKYLQQN